MIGATGHLLKNNFPPCYKHRKPTNLHFLNSPAFALHVEVDAAGPVNKVALLEHEFIPAVLRLQRERTVMNKVSSQCSARTARSRIFRNVVRGREETRVRARRTNLQRFACERKTSCCSATSVNVSQQRSVDMAIAQVSE